MSDEQKLELLKGKFGQLIQMSLQKDPKADTTFLLFFNAVKDNDALFEALVNDLHAQIDAQVEQAQKLIDEAPAKKAEFTISNKKTK